MLNDVRYALRMLVKTPAFTAVAVLTLALGIGANTAIFSVVNALLIRPLPYSSPDRLVMVWQDMRPRGGPAREWATPGSFADLKGAANIFENVAAVQGWLPALTGMGEPEPLVGEQVSHEYFDVLGVHAALGRDFIEAEDVPGAPRVVVLGHGLWARRFGSDPAVIGRIVTLGGEPHEIVGVMPDGFRPAVLPTAELWRPRRLNLSNPSRGAFVLRTVARLKPGLGFEQASSSASVLARQVEQAHPESNKGVGINLVSLTDQVVGDIRPGLLVLLGAVGFVLLIACVNIANLLLARGSGRAREIAVRMALGAMRQRVIQQLLTESVLLAAIGGALGVLLGVWGVAALVAAAPDGAPRLNEVGLDGTVLGFAILLTLLTGVFFGLAPALQASHAEFTTALKEGARGTAGGAGHRARRTLIVAEIAVALVLLVGSGLLLRTFLRLQAFDLGFDPQRVLVGTVIPPQAKYPTDAQRITFYDQLVDRAAALPGVQTAAISSVIPFGGDSDMSLWIEGRPAPRDDSESLATWYRLVSADYLKAMSIPLRRGRGFERNEPAPVVIVSDTAARRFWPSEEALGRHVRFSEKADAPWFTVVGVAGDVRVRGARGDARPEMYLPYWQLPEPGVNVVLKTAGDPALLAAPLRQAVRAIDPDMPVSGLAPMGSLVADSISQPRFFALLVAIFAGLAMTLAAVGIYGVMSYAVAQRTSEIGVRMALGAARRDIFQLVVGDGLRLAAIGVAIGLAGAFLIARSLTTLLFDIRPGDPLTFVSTAVLLLGVAALASFIPALRAARVDPMVALRRE
jgi:putative ABC transport system permease protein